MKIDSYKELNVYQNAMEAAMEIFQITKSFPSEEKYSMVDQIRRSSRSVCTNIAEAWRKRRYNDRRAGQMVNQVRKMKKLNIFLRFTVSPFLRLTTMGRTHG